MSKKKSSKKKSTQKPAESLVAGNHDILRFTDEQFIWRFSPNQTDSELLEAIFVGRENQIQTVLEKIKDCADQGSSHRVLLYGPRGIGKSHFTALLHHRIRDNAKLSKKVHLANLNEDETTTSLVQFLVRIYRALCKEYPKDYSAEWLDELLDQPPSEIANTLTSRLQTRFKNRSLVILVENLNLLFESLGAKGQHELRSLLQENPFISLVATSQQLFKAVTDRSEPFFGFFQQIKLNPLSINDAQELLVKIAMAKGQEDLAAFLQTADGRGRIRAIHDLAGGNHRVYIVLSGFVTRESLDQLVAPFQKMADDLTPYYQERLRWISPLQRQIVELLCRERQTLNPKEMARRLLLEQNSVGKQVRELVKIGYLSENKRGRETFYELSEPLMRLAFEVKEQSLLELLIEFLRIWYRPDQMEKLRKNSLSSTTKAYLDAAWERSQTHADPRIKLLKAELEKAKAEGRENELAQLWEEKAEASNNANDWLKAGYNFATINRDYVQSIACFEKMIELDPVDGSAWHNKGMSLNFLKEYSQARECFDMAIELNPDHVFAWCGKANSLRDLGNSTKALECYGKAIELDPDFDHAWNGKGNALQDLGNSTKALECFEKAIELDPDFDSAWNGKGNALLDLGNSTKALECYEKAIELDPDRSYPRFNRSEALFSLSRWKDGFDSIRGAFKTSDIDRNSASDAETIFSLIFKHSENADLLAERVSTLVDIYEQAAEDQGFEISLSSKREREAADPNVKSAKSNLNPLSHLADGLVKSLPKIDAERFSDSVLQSYVTAVENRVGDMPEFEIALRLFRYGIKYLISGKESEFVELISPERRILRQVFQLGEEDSSK